MAQPAAVEFFNVSKVYTDGLIRQRRVQALDDVSLSIGQGEVFGLVGPNRAGKTTLVKALLSICSPSSGRIVRLGRPWTDRSTLAQVGYVHESQAFPRYLSAKSLLEYYAALSLVPASVAAERIDVLLEQFGLSDRTREPIAHFSKGMLQRLAMAQALVNDPELLVLDEPSEGMDLSGRRLLHQVILDWKLKGRTTIIVSHALADVELLCDRVAVLRNGRLAKVAKTTELTGALSNRESRSLENALAPMYAGGCA